MRNDRYPMLGKVRLFEYIILFCFFLSASSCVDAFSGTGTGFTDDPFQITSCAELQEMKDDLTSSYLVMNDFDCAVTKSDPGTWGADGFDPVGNVDDAGAFSGVFDGGNHTISGLYLNRNTADDTSNNAGLFGRTNNATIKNVILTDIEYIASHFVGGLVGDMYGGSIANCQVSGTINPYPIISHPSTWNEIGGLVGNAFKSEAENAEISNSSTSVILNFDDAGSIDDVSDVGGFGGWLDGATVTNSHSTGAVNIGPTSNNVDYVGGFSGYTNETTISDSYSTGNVAVGNGGDSAQIGGFIGSMYKSMISNSYTSGLVTLGTSSTRTYQSGGFTGEIDSSTVTDSNSSGNVEVGNGVDLEKISGFAGSIYNDSTVSDSHATGNVTVGTSSSLAAYIGGFAGEIQDNSTISISYSTGNVTVGDGTLISNIGGFSGLVDDSTALSKSYSSGNVDTGNASSESDRIAGFVGNLINNSSLTNCYSRGNVTSNFDNSPPIVHFSLGGFVGDVDALSTITNTYSTGLVSTPNFSSENPDKGGLAGLVADEATITSSYWDKETSGLASSAGGAGVIGKITSEMKTQSTYSDWDFSAIWGMQSAINDGYPSFTLSSPTPTPAPSNNNNSSNSGSNGSGPWTCGDTVSSEIPGVFQANAIDTKMAIFFSPLTSGVNGYYLAFGTDPNNMLYGAQYGHYPGGVNKIIINDLSPNTLYYYKVRAQNGCATGWWSPTYKITTTRNKNTARVVYKDGSTKTFTKR
jgi:hypothetical protein